MGQKICSSSAQYETGKVRVLSERTVLFSKVVLGSGSDLSGTGISTCFLEEEIEAVTGLFSEVLLVVVVIIDGGSCALLMANRWMQGGG